MTITQAIEKAIEGGWKLEKSDRTSKEEQVAYLSLDPHAILLDPAFWQALGKVEGWQEEYAGCGNTGCSYCEDYVHEIPGWQYRMHRMIDALAEGKTIESFFESL